MIQIKKGPTYLDTNPNTAIDRERTSPFFSKDEIPGEVSYPFTLPASPTNLKDLGYIDQVAVQKDPRHDVILYDDGLQVSRGKLATEFVETDLWRNNSGSISAFTLSNASEFYQRIKGKNLSDLNLEGDRNFTWAGYSTTAAGFWKHIHDSTDTANMTDPAYTFYPIRNPKFGGDSDGWMNMLHDYNSVIEFARNENIFTLCPAIYLSYLLKRVFFEHGYSLTGSFLNDSDFKTVTIPSFYGIYWADAEPYIASSTVLDFRAVPLANITINLKQHVPPDYPISTFLVELQKFLPIGFEIDDNRRTCELVLLSDINTAGAKDVTKEISSSIKMSLEKEEKIFALKRDFDSADSHPSKPDFSKANMAGEHPSLRDIPNIFAPGAVLYIIELDQYYRLDIEYINGSPTYGWIHFADNIHSYEPAGNNDSLSCKITPMPLQEQEMYQPTTAGFGVHGFFPVCNQEGNWKFKKEETVPWQMRVLFYKGRLIYRDKPFSLPFAYPHIYHVNGDQTVPAVKIGNWSLSFVADGYGIYEKFFMRWFKTFANKESISAEWRPTLADYLSFRWKTPVLIESTPYMIQSIKETLPYYRPGDPRSGSVDIEARRMN